ncbi:hypothetical protein CDAR_72241 [Caerostris darwini]|uniref:Serine/threonine-protein phosphatase PGAM5, mitochondrial n=1 Tax=Caerostris darwini TaxID=1538125 RepID=A0AAV4MJY6_9ARAC|nr:hypothetical protein CDAR_72071 [Caerostris darwini]GIX72817.1 hypothetical protein CDAR_72241 [Caerostris darwini]
MVHVHRAKLFYAVAGSGVVLGLFNYFQSDKKTAKMAWTTNFQPSVKWDHNWDNRDYSSVVKPTTDENDQNKINEKKSKEIPTARRHIFLIRHGQYDIAARNDSDRRLTAIGKKQADLVGQRLKDLKFNYSKIIRSTMTRAKETSDHIHNYFPNLPVDNCDLLREGFPIQPEPPSKGWSFPDEQYIKDGSRIEAAFRKYFHRADVNQTSDSYEIIVCHANVIRYFICRLLQFPPEAWLRFQLHHCSMTWVVIVPSGRVGVYAIGDSGFLPEELLTG